MRNKTGKILKSFCVMFVIFMLLAVASCDSIMEYIDNFDANNNSGGDNTSLLNSSYILYENIYEGISFEYPKEWHYIDESELGENFIGIKDMEIILCLSPVSEDAILLILKGEHTRSFLDYEKDIFFGSIYEEFIENFGEEKIDDITEIYGEDINIVDFMVYFIENAGYTEIVMQLVEFDGVSAVKVYNDNDEVKYVLYVYTVDRKNIYIVLCMSPEDKFNEYEPVFEKIMSSYTCK